MNDCKKMIIIRGVSGAGKSTFAEYLFNLIKVSDEPVTWLEADKYLLNEYGEYDWSSDRCYHAHKQLQVDLGCFLSNHPERGTVIISNTTVSNKAMKVYTDLADEYGYTVTSFVMENRHGGVNVHDVPEESLAIMEERLSKSIKLR